MSTTKELDECGHIEGGIGMDDILVVAVGGIIVTVLAYFAGQQRADRRHDRDHADDSARERREQRRALATKMVDEFVDTVRRHYADGPYALAPLGLEALESDKLIREAIAQRKARSSLTRVRARATAWGQLLWSLSSGPSAPRH